MNERELLERILANQVVMSRQIEKIQEKLDGKSSSKGYGSVVRKLEREAEKALEYLR